MKTFLEEIRLPDEKKILDYLEKVLNVGTISDLLNFDANQKKDHSMSSQMLFNLPLSPQVGAHLYELTQEILQLLEYTDREVSFYISKDSSVNAKTYFNCNEEEPHYVVFNSCLVERLTDGEMRFVIGHELGHLIYRHTMLEFVMDHLYPRFSIR
ncbi:MAG TPA: M48 family metalloprotease [Bacteroidales bacterium]|jgi:Zn-dependent protease with chaperone function|nr:M48 family metalloprotease [Bacteroidales bacterium]